MDLAQLLLYYIHNIQVYNHHHFYLIFLAHNHQRILYFYYFYYLLILQLEIKIKREVIFFQRNRKQLLVQN